MRAITGADVRLTLELLGIVPGDKLLMHSALSSIGHVKGGADTIIDGILDYLGSEGTLAMSALSDADNPFDPATTPTTVGIIAETFRRREGTLRSYYPVQSITAAGKHSRFITSGHEKCSSGYGEGSPFFKLRDLDAKILLLGVDQDRNTFLHCVEAYLDSPYLTTLDVPAPVYMPEKEKFTLTKFPPGHRDFTRIMPHLRREGLLEEARLGNALVRCMPMQRLFTWAVDQLRRDPNFFLCISECCPFCAPARRGALDEIVFYE